MRAVLKEHRSPSLPLLKLPLFKERAGGEVVKGGVR